MASWRGRVQESVLEALGVALSVIVRHELRDRVLKRVPPEVACHWRKPPWPQCSLEVCLLPLPQRHARSFRARCVLRAETYERPKRLLTDRNAAKRGDSHRTGSRHRSEIAVAVD
jgi:hypothetical protein